MLELDWNLHDSDDVTLVAVVVESTAPTPRRVRIESRLEASVRPPRRRGVPEHGWTEDGYEGVVPAEGRLAMGFACLAGPTEPPVEIVEDERADVEPDDPQMTDTRTAIRTGVENLENPSPTDVLRELGPPAPPQDAVPDSEPATTLPRKTHDTTGASGDIVTGAGGDVVAPGGQGGRSRRGERNRRIIDKGSDHVATDEVFAPVASWLACVESRVERIERLAESRELTAATDAVAATGGLVEVEELLATVAADRAALRTVARDAGALAERSAVVEEVPLDAYRRLS